MVPVSWTWLHALAATILYWIVLIACWAFYVSRPSVRARAWERDFTDQSKDPETGRMIVTLSSSTSLLPTIVALLAPPAVLFALWLFAPNGF
jgi:hypothetical protein